MKKIYLSALSKLTSLSISTLTFIFTIILLASVNIATILSSAVFDILFSGLSRMVPTEWIATSYSTINKDQRTKINQLSSQNQKLKSKNNSLMKKTSHIKTKVSNVVKSIQGRTKRLAATTIAGLPAEAIPFIGTAAIVGSAAYEINAACDTMIDLHELDVVFNPDNEFDSSVCGMEVPSTEQLRESWSRYYGEIGKAFYKWMNE